MQEIVFIVQGSEPKPYRVTFSRIASDNLAALCTCQAGVNGLHCRHRLDILAGNTDGIISENKADVETVLTWLIGTKLESLLRELKNAESVLEKTKAEVKALKKKVAKALYGK